MVDDVNDEAGTPGDKPVTLEARSMSQDGRRFSPSSGRNKDAVRDAFLAHMPDAGTVLEIASGTGEHGAHILKQALNLAWQYSDIDCEGLQSQNAWAAYLGDGRLRGALELDVTTDDWGAAEAAGPYDGLFCANMIHISPIGATRGLFAGAGRVLRSGGRMMLYGPFSRGGEMVESNQLFDRHLKGIDPAWGVRDLDTDILPLAEQAGLRLVQTVAMPSNNLSVFFERG
ncbi:MAG: DUF938 domain-containing protein [Alphaproteobacteria bacterium]|nr:DUF938 domain-containing protein [Alphaproteobacteria bacterium]